MPDSQFQEEEMNVDEELAQSSPSPKSVNSLSLQDAQELVASLSAIALKLGNNDKGVIATLNQLLKQAEVLDKEQREQIVPLLGNLKALLETSQEELKQFNAQAQKGLEVQIRDVIANVDFSPIEKKVTEANKTILESSNALLLKAGEIEKIANRTQTLGFYASTKYLLVGLLGGACVLYGFFSFREHNFEQNLQAQYDAKWQEQSARFQNLNLIKNTPWNVVKTNEGGRELLQFVFKDTGKQVQCGWVDTKQSGMGYPVSYINIPIYK